MTTLLSLYPRAWRERYEDEFIALLEARPPDARDRVDIIRGALDARLHPRADLDGSLEPLVPLPYNGPWNIRRAGQITLAGGFVYVGALLVAINGPLVDDGATTYRDGSGGFLPFFLAITLLLIGTWAVAATLPSTSRVARVATVVGAVAGILWSIGPWMLPIGAVMCAAIVIVAIEAARTDRWRWSDAIFLVGGVVAAVGVAGMALAGLAPSLATLPMYERDLQFVMLLCLAPLWFATAHALLRPAIPVADPVEQPMPVA